MKLKLLTSATPLVALFAFSAQLAVASNSATMEIDGTIMAGTCDVSVDKQNIDLGDILYSSLSSTAVTNLPDQNVSMSIICSESSLVAWKFIDNRADSVSSELPGAVNSFGLGYDTDGNPIGGYGIVIGNAVAVTDTGNAYTTQSLDNGFTWSTQGGPWNYIRGAFYASADNLPPSQTPARPEYFRTLSNNVTIKPQIASRSSLDLSREARLDGAFTIELHYL